MIQLQQVSLQRGQRVLLSEVNLTIHAQQKIGLVGINGSGKTSLLLLLQGELTQEQGEVNLPNGLIFAHIRQAMPAGTTTAIEYALQGDKEYTNLQNQLNVAEQQQNGLEIAAIHNRLAEIGGYAIPSQAAKILLGLGFSQNELSQPIDSFSGGWRMRLNLAQVLMARADLLLLDEPTNHLDLEAIIWLEDWLHSSSQTMLLISHDREFLDHVITHTAHLHDKKLKLYSGNYSAFEKQRAEQLAVQAATFEKQQKARAHLQKFVDRFRAKASKARQAQSRVKMLERMQQVANIHAQTPLTFQFKPCVSAGTPMLQFRDGVVGYDDKMVLKDLSFSISDGDRMGLIGPNGAGKSTLIKLIAEKLRLTAGKCQRSNKIKLGYFAQHQLEQLDTQASALLHLQRIDKQVSEREGRTYLGGFNFHGDDVFRAIDSFSGGEKARLVLALLIWQAPNLLLLDEPTNHLDMDMREALNLALQQYTGVLIVVSHDRYFLKSIIDELWLIADGSVTPFNGDVDDYRTWLLDYTNQKNEKQTIKKNKASHRDLQKTKQRLESQLQKLDSKLEQAQQKLVELDTTLTNSELYQPEHKQQLEQLLLKHQTAKQQITDLEEKIMDIMQSLEE